MSLFNLPTCVAHRIWPLEHGSLTLWVLGLLGSKVAEFAFWSHRTVTGWGDSARSCQMHGSLDGLIIRVVHTSRSAPAVKPDRIFDVAHWSEVEGIKHVTCIFIGSVPAAAACAGRMTLRAHRAGAPAVQVISTHWLAASNDKFLHCHWFPSTSFHDMRNQA